MTCPLCHDDRTTTLHDGVRDFEYGAPGTYAWLACTGCGLVRLDPMPTAEVLALAYPPDYHAYGKPESKLTAWLIERSRNQLAKHLAQQLPDRGTVLDIGCSTGDLLTAIGQLGNYQLWGVEYKPEAAEEARARGIKVWQGDFDQADLPSCSLDLVLMQHVLEHVSDPIATLAKVFDALRPGGLVRGELPNLHCWDAALFGRYWGGGHAPRHLWHFTPATLRRALKQAGFTDIRLSPALHTGHWALSVQNALRRHRTDTTGLRRGRTWYYPWLLLATIPINLLQMPLLQTGIMRFAARRPS